MKRASQAEQFDWRSCNVSVVQRRNCRSLALLGLRKGDDNDGASGTIERQRQSSRWCHACTAGVDGVVGVFRVVFVFGASWGARGFFLTGSRGARSVWPGRGRTLDCTAPSTAPAPAEPTSTAISGTTDVNSGGGGAGLVGGVRRRRAMRGPARGGNGRVPPACGGEINTAHRPSMLLSEASRCCLWWQRHWPIRSQRPIRSSRRSFVIVDCTN